MNSYRKTKQQKQQKQQYRSKDYYKIRTMPYKDGDKDAIPYHDINRIWLNLQSMRVSGNQNLSNRIKSDTRLKDYIFQDLQNEIKQIAESLPAYSKFTKEEFNSPDKFSNIIEFLYKKGIGVLIKEKNEITKNLDGLIVEIYEKNILLLFKPRNKDRDRINFSIGYILYYLDKNNEFGCYNPNSYASKFLITPSDYKLAEADRPNAEKMIRKMYQLTYGSNRAILKGLISNGYLSGKESDYEYLLTKLKFDMENKRLEKYRYTTKLNSTLEYLNEINKATN